MDSPVVPITAYDLSALRLASSASAAYFDGRAWLRLYRRPVGRDVFTAQEQRLYPDTSESIGTRSRDIACDASLMVYDGRQHEWSNGDGTFAMWAYASLNRRGCVNSLARVVRKGDTLRLTWVRGNDNEAYRAVDFHRDELYLDIPDRRMSIPLDVYVGPDNSARMIQAS